MGPAGRELARGLEAAGIERGDAYITNVVKHFKYKARGKRRIQQKPDARERGRPVDSPLAGFVTATIHPSAILRLRDEAERAEERVAFAADLRTAAAALG